MNLSSDSRSEQRHKDQLYQGNKNRTCQIVDIAVPADHWVKLKEGEKRDKYLDLARELKTKEHESDGDTYCNR